MKIPVIMITMYVIIHFGAITLEGRPINEFVASLLPSLDMRTLVQAGIGAAFGAFLRLGTGITTMLASGGLFFNLLGKMVLWDYAFLTGDWIILRLILIAFSLMLMLWAVVSMRGNPA